VEVRVEFRVEVRVRSELLAISQEQAKKPYYFSVMLCTLQYRSAKLTKSTKYLKAIVFTI